MASENKEKRDIRGVKGDDEKVYEKAVLKAEEHKNDIPDTTDSKNILEEPKTTQLPQPTEKINVQEKGEQDFEPKEELQPEPVEKAEKLEKLEESLKPSEKPAATPPIPISASRWFSRMHWKTNPFTFTINPDIFVGYKKQEERLFMALEGRHKFIYLAGPTGSGKTTMLRWLSKRLDKKFDTLFVAKPPAKQEEFVYIFNEKFPRGFAFWKSHIRNIYQLPVFLNKKLDGKHMILMIDEAHEAETDVLEWLRVLGDQVNSMTILLSGLPVFERYLIENLETFRKRIAAKIELVSLTKEETEELIRRRIQNVGGSGSEFPQDVLDFIFVQSGGFPREVLRICDMFVSEAMLRGTTQITKNLIHKEDEKEEPASLGILETMTPMQKDLIELLAQGAMTPGDAANTMNLSKYKSRQHAVRSINNIMKKLYEDGYLDRQRSDKAFVYSLSGKLRTLVVKA